MLSDQKNMEEEEEEEETKSDYSSVNSDRMFEVSQREKINVKIHEEFSSLLILLAHNVNLRDLPF
jgi:hypothetical protein